MSKYSNNMPPRIGDAIGWMYGDIKPNALLLDFGCSTGYFAKYLIDNKQCRVRGVEISDDRYEAEKILEKVYSFDLDGDWPDDIYENVYDYLFFGDVIEHLKDPLTVLIKAKKLLKKDGKIFISTPNIAHISIRLELLLGNFEYENMGILDNTHLKYFTLNSLKKLVSDGGYSLDRVDASTNDFPRPIIEKLLKRTGLVPSDKFWKITESREARTFQYKLVLSKPTASVKKTSYPRIPQKPEQFRDGVLLDLRGQVENLRNHAKEQAKIIDHYVNEVKMLKDKTGLIRLSKKISNRIKRK